MEFSKKQVAFYTIFLLTVASGLTMVIAPPPEEGLTLWDRLWKVEEPVSVEGTVIVDSSTPIEVALSEPIEVDGTVNIGNTVDVVVTDMDITSGVRVLGKTTFVVDEPFDTNYGRSKWIDVSGMKTIYVYIEHTHEAWIKYSWTLNDDTHYWDLPGSGWITYTTPGFHVLTIDPVVADSISLEFVSKADGNYITIWIYASPV